MNFVKEWFIKMEAEKMLTKLWASLDGKKTYILSALGIVVAIVGHFFGPTTIAGIAIPTFSWDEVWKTVWASGLFSALRNGVEAPKGA